MDTTPKIVLQNPYRILGVYANAPKRDIVANKGKAIAFLKVNKPVEYPLDLKGILPTPNRNLDLMNEAEAHLAIAKEQIKYAQFWFLQKMSPLDDIAFNHLLVGNLAEAIEIWSKQEFLSSLQNKLVCYLIESKHELAVKTAERLYERFGNDYISKVDANCTIQMTPTDLLHQFIDSLGGEIGMQKMLGFALGTSPKAYISSQTIVPLIDKISSEVDKAKRVDHKDPKARIEAARKLMANTKESFSQLKSILPPTDSQYQMIADKLGLELLQCGIDYFNNSKDDDAPHTAMKLQKHAQLIVVGNLAKQRCDENIKVLEKIISELPPKEIIGDNNEIMSRITSYSKSPKNISNAMSLLNGTKQHLQSIKKKLGEKNAFYLKLSTLVVTQALHGVIVEVNASQNPIEESKGMMYYELYSYDITPEQKQQMLDRIKKAISNAWNAIVIMDGFDIDTNFKQHYYQNRKTIKSMCKQLGIETSWEPLPAGGFAEYGGFWSYIKSEGSSRWQAALIVQILSIGIGYGVYLLNNGHNIKDYMSFGVAIGACAWLCILIDNDEREFQMPKIERGGCVAVVALISVLAFYYTYKAIRLAIDGIKRI